VQQIIAANYRSIGIREDGKGIASFSGQLAGNIGSINADCCRTNACLLKLFQVFLNAS